MEFRMASRRAGLIIAAIAVLALPVAGASVGAGRADRIATHIDRPCDPVVTAEPTSTLCGPPGQCTCRPAQPIRS
jgi:hypothetical protein